MYSPSIAPHVQAFFADYLCQQRRLSPQTIISCRDTFRLLLTFLRDQTGVEPSAVRIADIDAPVVLRFLNYLEQDRGNSVRSRNIRLSAIRSFFRLVSLRDPDSLGIVTRVLAIPNKREDQKLIGYLTRPEIQALVVAPDQSKWVGRRDHALLLTLYNSGARVSEITMLKRDQAYFGDSTFLQLFGKGRKERTIPLWAETVQVLRAWFQELGEHTPNIAFPSVRGKSLSRDGVDYLLKRAVQRAVVDCPSLTTKKISPHIIRHTTAMHLLQAGVDIATIALWLGHESIETTHVYLQADLAMKEEALGKLDPIEGGWQRFQADDPLLAFLASL
ncbi:MAG: site-specific integrase [Candidatus Tectomicrobia bacterium]